MPALGRPGALSAAIGSLGEEGGRSSRPIGFAGAGDDSASSGELVTYRFSYALLVVGDD